MKKPAELKEWLDEKQLLEWLKSSSTVEEYRKRMVIWLTHFRKWHAAEIAEMTGVSVQAIWLWVGRYNKKGPGAFAEKKHGGRRWAFLTLDQERVLLNELNAQVGEGVVTAKKVHEKLCEILGKKVSLGYVYQILHRNEWHGADCQSRRKRQ
jgi:transposase